MDTLLNYCKNIKRRLEDAPGRMKATRPWEEFALYVLTHQNAEQFVTGDAHYVFLHSEFCNDRVWAKPFKEFAQHYKKWISQ